MTLLLANQSASLGLLLYRSRQILVSVVPQRFVELALVLRALIALLFLRASWKSIILALNNEEGAGIAPERENEYGSS